MYFLNHGEKLKLKLQSQIRQFEINGNIEKLKILRYICLADKFCAKVQISKLLNKAGIIMDLAGIYIGSLEREYLLKLSDDSNYLTGMHYVRSNILCEILFEENEYVDKLNYIDDLISIIDESDLHYFLLNSFENHYDVNRLLNIIRDNNLNFTLIGMVEILKALIWKGVYDFIFVSNLSLFEKLYDELHSSWWLALPYDYSGTIERGLSGSMREIFKKFNPKLLNFIDDISTKFSPKDDVYKYAREWLKYTESLNIDIVSINELNGLGLYYFWSGYLNNKCTLNIDSKKIVEIINSNNISIEELAELILGLEYISASSGLIDSLRSIGIKKLRDKYTILKLIIEDEIDCLYAYNLIRFDANVKELCNSSNVLHDTSIHIIDLLRKIYPYCTRYNIRCVGVDSLNQYILAPSDYDPSVKHINRKNLPFDQLVQINQLIVNMFTYSKRIDTWDAYTQRVFELRNSYNNLMCSLINNFSEYFRTSDVRKFIPICEELIEIIKQDTQLGLPKIVSDKWGYEKEHIDLGEKIEHKDNNKRDRDFETKKNKPSISLKYVKYSKCQSDYFNALHRLFSQLQNNIVDTYKIQQGESVDNHNANLPFAHLKEALLENLKFTSEITDKFSKYYNSNEMDALANQERINLLVILNCWIAFVNNKPISKLFFTNNRLDFFVFK